MRLSFLASKRKTLMIDMGSVALSTARTMKLAGWPAVRRTPAFGPSMMSFVLALPIPKMTALALARVRIWTDCFSSLATVPSGRTVTISPMNSGSGVVSGNRLGLCCTGEQKQCGAEEGFELHRVWVKWFAEDKFRTNHPPSKFCGRKMDGGIIRKSKCSTDFKRNDFLKKNRSVPIGCASFLKFAYRKLRISLFVELAV